MKIFGLIISAYQASEAVDYFDLRSEDPESCRKWKELLKEQMSTARELIEFCQREGDETLKTFDRWKVESKWYDD